MTKKGRIELYSIKHEYVTSKAYKSVKDRNEIIEKWKRKYPKHHFYVIIQPELNKFLKDEY